ncbi:hypothetical protein [Aeromonas veronii]|uniref:hypothetical protein n=1 Tax=Aeromonas veronii TaxID=654 RepID=UPI00123A2183|nr:hypothetical protein [Aeromonas veronii]QET78131.1 hypothetical protein FOB40_01950 [Aeromonas veronii]
MTEHRKADTDKKRQDEEVVAPKTEVIEPITQPITCGLIMPIAANEVGSAEHWLQVRKIISDALMDTNLKIKMVSESDEVNVIHHNIVANIYTNEIIVCDVSSRNPNVMFELGMRLTFDKPVVIIKDRETPFSFDVGNIQHLEYPRTLNYVEIQKFQQDLKNKVLSTLEASKENGYSPFLKYYKITQVSKVETEVVGREDYMISAINELKKSVDRINYDLDLRPEPVKFKNAYAYNGDGLDLARQRTMNSIENDIFNTIKEEYDGVPFDTKAMYRASELMKDRFNKGLSLEMQSRIIERLAERMNNHMN